MNTPGVIDGVIVAALISVGAGVASLLLGGFVDYPILFQIVLYSAALTYLLYLLKRSDARVGRVVAIATWSLMTLICWLLDVHLLEQVLLQATVIWLVRSLYFHNSMFTALLDLGLISVGLAASAWAMLNTGSLVASIWSFFLVQAMFCWVPRLGQSPGDAGRNSPQNRSSFQSAHRVAVDAVRKLSQS
jgi:hypothetical protein